jgi:hypothetical protein
LGEVREGEAAFRRETIIARFPHPNPPPGWGQQAADRGQAEVAENWAATKQAQEAEADVIRNAVQRADELAVRERRRAASE